MGNLFIGLGNVDRELLNTMKPNMVDLIDKFWNEQNYYSKRDEVNGVFINLHLYLREELLNLL